MKRKQDQKRERKKEIRIMEWLFVAVLLAFAFAGCGAEAEREQSAASGKAGEEASASGQAESDSLAADGSVMAGEDSVMAGEDSDMISAESKDSGETVLSEEGSIPGGQLLKAVLLGEARFLYSANGDMEDITIADVPALFDENDPYMKIWNFAAADLDGDGEEEVILFVSGAAGDMGGKLILHQVEEEVYGYRTDNRTLVDLKTDGTYGYSNPTGTAEEGIAAITGFADLGLGKTDFVKSGFSESDFSEIGFTTDKITYATGTPKGWEVFVVDHETATEDEYLDAISRQQEKQDVLWYEFTEENIGEIWK